MIARQPETRPTISKAYDWLVGNPVSSPERHAAAIDWLLAAWICERALEREHSSARDGATRFADHLASRSREEAFRNLFACNALHLAFAHRVLNALHIDCPHLETFISGLSGSLESIDHTTPGAHTLLETRRALGGRLSSIPAMSGSLSPTALPPMLEAG